LPKWQQVATTFFCLPYVYIFRNENKIPLIKKGHVGPQSPGLLGKFGAAPAFLNLGLSSLRFRITLPPP